jgi:threonine dehydratase
LSFALLADVGGLDLVLAPVGGGGLASGTALSAAAAGVPVVLAEPAGADDAYRSFVSGVRQPSEAPRTIADGLLTALGELPFVILRAHVRAIVTVSEASIVEAMPLVWTRMKVIIEPSSAVALAAVLEGQIPQERLGIIVSGGNVDLDHLPW